MKNVLEYLENSAQLYPDKIAAKDDRTQIKYSELVTRAKETGTYVAGICTSRKPVVVFMEKSVRTLTLFMGIVYAGDFYVLIDPSFPLQRIQQIISVLEPELIITNENNLEKLKTTGYEGKIVCEDNIGTGIDENILNIRRSNQLDTDPLYGIFTSGSTGVPKGVVICHRSVIDFINTFTDTFNITSEDVIGNQAPFDFDVSVKDIYSCLKTGATLVIIPKSYFMFPNNVIDMLDDNKVTTLIWAVSALCLLNRLHGLKYKVPSCINKIMFSGEMMPVKQLNAWRSFYPDAMFVNLYGPTEITCNCTYYILDREFSDDEKLPMGRPFENERVFLLDDDNNQVTQNDVPAEVSVAGTCLALGYYNNPEMTAKAFTLNPLNKAYPELIYHTGDLAVLKDDGHMYFAGRKDFQIKHMGHRIELEEIEVGINAICGVERASCFFDDKKNKIVCFYTGQVEKAEVVSELRTKVPDFMVPNVFMPIDDMPLTKNGKIDRTALKEIYGGK